MEWNRRNTYLMISIVALLAFILVAGTVYSGRAAYDESLYRMLIEGRKPWLDAAFIFISHLGGPIGVIGVNLLLVFAPNTRYRYGYFTSGATIVSFLLNSGYKLSFARPRPEHLRLVTETSYSFPSGHAMNNAALYATLILLAFAYWDGQLVKVGAVLGAGVFLLLVGASRVYLGIHYPSDVLAGYCMGFAVAFAVAAFASRGRRTWRYTI